MLLSLLNLPNGTHKQQIPASAASSAARIINTELFLGARYGGSQGFIKLFSNK